MKLDPSLQMKLNLISTLFDEIKCIEKQILSTIQSTEYIGKSVVVDTPYINKIFEAVITNYKITSNYEIIFEVYNIKTNAKFWLNIEEFEVIE